jgi:diguanylate cyclase (GGDEF)-like protein
MNDKQTSIKSPPSLQQQRVILPAMLTVLLLLGALIVNGLITPTVTEKELILLLIGIAGTLYVFVMFYIIMPSLQRKRKKTYTPEIVAAINGLSLGLLAYLIPEQLSLIVFLFIILSTLITAVVIGRRATYIFIIALTLTYIPWSIPSLNTILNWIRTLSLPIIVIIINETILRLLEGTEQNVQRLTIINEFSRKIASSLDTEQALSLLNAAIQNALEADTYYVGLLEKDQIKLNLFYDDGEFFSNVAVPLAGTLSGWVIKNGKSLFIPDLREEPDLEGVQKVIIGKEKTSLSWVGVPMITSHAVGIIALASYTPNAFNAANLELLENLAQIAALSIDNTYRHAEVKEQSRRDSLTGAYNHGYFLKVLQDQAYDARLNHTPLSLIMLDIDFFKQYNDRYGHLFGDRVLTTLTNIIAAHVKSADAVGRWGGEEFAISLPGADGAQARKVAERIRDTMATTILDGQDQGQVPVPTVSQGIALFPDETEEIIQLVDLADRRLYVAKERGRNEIEPGLDYWGNQEQAEN